MTTITDAVRAHVIAGEPVALIEKAYQENYQLALAVTAWHVPDYESRYAHLISPLGLLNEPYMLRVLVEQLTADKVVVLVDESAQPTVNLIESWYEPLEVEHLDLGDDRELFGFQQFAIRRAIDASNTGRRARRSGFFFNFGTGTGKSVVATAGAQELFNRDAIDLALFFTMSKLRVNLARQVEAISSLGATVVEGDKALRRRRYAETEADVIVLNYEKAKFDYDELAALVDGRRVMFVLDEVSKVLRGDNPRNKSRVSLDALIKHSRTSVVWPMSATIVKSSPLRYHDAYETMTPVNPLGTRSQFVERYVRETESYQVRPGVMVHNHVWDLPGLAEVRHRVHRYTMAVRKTDPGVREYFKGMTTEVIYVQPSPAEIALRDAILTTADRHGDLNDDVSMATYYSALRYTCNAPGALAYSDSEIANGMAESLAEHIRRIGISTKFEMIADKVEEIAEAGDQVAIFTQWTWLTLFHLAKVFHERGIRYVTHHGGMSATEAQAAQDSFKSNKEVTAFLSSDAGAYGLNFQNARYVINVECPYDPDLLTQRNDRIDRADSYLDGLTSYIYVVEGSVEQDIWATNERRRATSAAVQGTVETLSRYSAEELTEGQAMRALLRSGLARK